MATSGITLKRSAVPGKVPTTANLSLGELALNTHDGILYFKKDDGVSEEVLALSPVTGGVVYSVKTANYSAADKDGILADTTAGSFTITLPETPTAGMQVYIADPNSWETNPVIVSPGAGISIESFAPGEDLALDVVGALCTFIYSGTKWKLYLTPGPEGISGSGGDVTGPASAADNEVVLFDGASGKLVKSGGVLGTGAFVEQERWKPQAYNVQTLYNGIPAFVLGSYYPDSPSIVSNGDLAANSATGDVYTLTDGSWVLTDQFSVSNGFRILIPRTGTSTRPLILVRTSGVTSGYPINTTAAAVRYVEGTAGVDLDITTVAAKLSKVGRLKDLSTPTKTTIVAAINEVLAVANQTGDLNQLTTTTKTSSVAAINEVVASKLNKSGDTLTGALNWAAPVTIASATTVDLSTTTSNRVNVTGSSAISSFGTAPAGTVRTLAFSGSPILTYSGAYLVLPGAVNIQAAPGDVAEFESMGTGKWRCTSYLRSGATPIGGGSFNSSVDLNTITTSGFYRINASPVNAPTGSFVDYGQLIVSRGGDTILQIVSGYSNGLAFFRHGNPPDVGGPGPWSAWRPLGNMPVREVTTTGNYMYGSEADSGLNTVNVFTYNGKVDKYLPPNPLPGDRCVVVVANGRTDNAIYVDAVSGSQRPIMGLNETMTLDSANASVTFMYVNPTLGWRIV